MPGCRGIVRTLVVAVALSWWIATPVIAQDAAENALWEIIKDSGDATLFNRFLESYPNGPHAADANARVRELGGSAEQRRSAPPYESEAAILWDELKSFNLPEVAEQFLEQYPEASDAVTARLNLELLRNPPPPPLPKANRDWTTIENPRFGFAVDIPPGFQSTGGDLTHEIFDYHAGGASPILGEDPSITLTSFYVAYKTFEQHIAAWIEDLRGLAEVTHLTLTPTSARWRWDVDGGISQFAAISLCDGETFVAVSLLFHPGVRDIQQETIERLRNSLRATGGGEDCVKHR